MSQQRLTESPEKTQQRIERRESRPAAPRSFPRGFQPILQLQRTIGNRAVGRLIHAKRLTPDGKLPGVQRQLTVGAADDPYEQEADRVAGQVLNTPDAGAAHALQRAMAPEEDQDQMLQPKPLAASITPFMQRQIEQNTRLEDQEQPVQAKLFAETGTAPVQRQREMEEDETAPLQAKSAGALTDSFEAGAEVETQINQSKGRGSPLPDMVHTYMESRFGVDFSQVRAHTGSDALQMNQAVGAQAFTHGSDIYFGAGHSPTDLGLTAHELTHVIQQTGSPPLQTKKREEEVAPPGPEPSIQRICAACAAVQHSASAESLAPPVQRKTVVSGPKTLQRDMVKTQAPNWGEKNNSKSFVTINPSASVSVTNVSGASKFDSFNGQSANATFNLLPGSAGQLTYRNLVLWHQDNFDPAVGLWTVSRSKQGTIPITVAVQFSVSADGKVQFISQPVKNGGGGEPGLLVYNLDPSTSISGDGDASLNIQESLAALSAASTTNKADTQTNEERTETSTHYKGGGEVDIKGVKIGGEVDTTKTVVDENKTRSTGVETGQSTSGGLNWLFGHSVVLTGIKPKVKGLSLTGIDIHFKKFEGQTEIEDGDKGKILDWLIEFPEKDLLFSRKIKLKVIGHASEPGSNETNQNVLLVNGLPTVTKQILAFNPNIEIVSENQAK